MPCHNTSGLVLGCDTFEFLTNTHAERTVYNLPNVAILTHISKPELNDLVK